MAITLNGTTGITTADIAATTLTVNAGYGSNATAYLCRAWVNFDGTSTVAIRDSANVSSITDNGTGDYTVNFTTAMPDANYSVANSIGSGAVVTSSPAVARQAISATASYRYTSVYASAGGSAAFDYSYQMLSFFR
jgi:hypothetical protein